MRRKVNVAQVCASIRLDLMERLGIEVPTEEIRIVWSGGERKVWINVNERRVWGSLDGRIMRGGKI
ncbi:hypothetical protein LCGC14_2259910 [marine sediment metagenome]|uniref:Uncharacterized protein n=1 Tax=marine sediment metagenome TaxID=412755 RepID=A0A0F9D0B6_9ZZZZ